MDATERLHWLETRILSSLRPRADDLRRIFSRDDSRATFLEFFANDDAHRLVIRKVRKLKIGGGKYHYNIFTGCLYILPAKAMLCHP